MMINEIGDSAEKLWHYLEENLRSTFEERGNAWLWRELPLDVRRGESSIAFLGGCRLGGKQAATVEVFLKTGSKRVHDAGFAKKGRLNGTI